jgi:hypothetical protein
MIMMYLGCYLVHIYPLAFELPANCEQVRHFGCGPNFMGPAGPTAVRLTGIGVSLSYKYRDDWTSLGTI